MPGPPAELAPGVDGLEQLFDAYEKWVVQEAFGSR